MKVGIIGAGKIAAKMADTLYQMEEAECYAIASRDLKKAEQFALKFHIPNAFGSYEELVKDPAVELIYIATPHSHHFEQAKMCLEHGKPVLCEKSFTANARQARELFALAKEKNVFITEALWTKYMPSRWLISDLLAQNEIGDVTMCTANLGYNNINVPRLIEPALAGGALLDVGIYPLGFISMFMGHDIESIHAICTLTDTGMDAQNSITLKYKDGRIAQAHSSVIATTEQCGIIYGRDGYIIAENINNVDLIKIYTRERELKKVVEVPEQINGFEYQVLSSMKAIREGKIECPELPHADILWMMEVMDEVRRQGGVVYPFD